MNVFSIFAQTTLLTCTLVGATALQASVIINSTRVVYPQNDKEVTVRLESKNQAPVLVQTWLDNGDEQSTPQVGGIPFVVTPPIFRMEPGKQQVVRVAYTGEPLPTAQESLFWFNLLEVPAQSPNAQQGNQLQLAFRSRIKLFFRPHNLLYGVETAPGKLQWRRISSAQGQGLEVFNPTPYHVTFEAVEVLESGQRHARKTASSGSENMVLPGGRLRFELPTLKASANTEATVEFQTLDDYGVKAVHSAKAPP
ncbi:MAG: molecular chaperone [Pseudomonas sp.]|uniref:fimbrial biogenesis chaperone n=1 Tax=Pseudomonas TaxID=286 RepID=UPI0009362F64|nr:MULTISPECIES: molecular chaperone [unclassified Pseudomonas]MDN5399057.1 molecular chaperone [Pseudomonas sp.]MDN5420206.1 molecular chaperone [Pseudomonadales bacterium]MDN5427133.1 molecular chaperone [Pseudomonadales bacterium]MDN5507988.1 molecular chaperone [Pseudomonas sp.]OJT32224.1 pilus assembly protein [Pseudomonas sp. FSL W5-0203]